MAATDDTILVATCHCKAVSLTFPAPDEPLNACQCSPCRRLGAMWAYYKNTSVQIKGDTDTYECNDKTILWHRCKVCGCLTHWTSTVASRPATAVNCNMLDLEDLARFEVDRTQTGGPAED